MNSSEHVNFSFKTIPWGHQLMALKYLYKRNCAALYTDMGTGKSKVMIDLIVNKGFFVTVIACTVKGCDSWVKQFQIHSNLTNVINLAGKSQEKKLREVEAGMHKDEPLVLLCNYDSIWREPFSKLLISKKFPIDCVICDESHRIKSPSSKCSRFLSKLGKRVQYRYLVTGTPLAENPSDIYAQYRFLDPNIFGTSLTDFRAKYENLDVNITAKVGYRVLDKKEPYINLDDLRDKMFSCAFMEKSAIKLPKRLNIIKEFGLSKDAEKAYQGIAYEGVFQSKDGFLTVENALSLATRKQQVTSGFLPIETLDEKKSIAKFNNTRIEICKELLEDLPKDEPVVIFAKYRWDLTELRNMCKESGWGYSEISGVCDEETDWQSGKTRILGIQYASGSESITLTRAHYCIYYSLTYELSLYRQSKKRIHRPGQDQTCIYYYLVSRLTKGKSIDRVILEAIQKKESIVDSIVRNVSGNN